MDHTEFWSTQVRCNCVQLVHMGWNHNISMYQIGWSSTAQAERRWYKSKMETKVQEGGVEPPTSAVLRPRHNQLDHPCILTVTRIFTYLIIYLFEGELNVAEKVLCCCCCNNRLYMRRHSCRMCSHFFSKICTTVLPMSYEYHPVLRLYNSTVVQVLWIHSLQLALEKKVLGTVVRHE